MRVLAYGTVLTALFLTGCGARAGVDEVSAPVSPRSQVVFQSETLRVEQVVHAKDGDMDSRDALEGPCAASIAYALQGDARVLVGRQWTALRASDAMQVAGQERFGVAAGDKRATVLLATANVPGLRCAKANTSNVYRAQEHPFEPQPSGALQVRVLVGGQGDEQVPASLAELRGAAGFSVPEHTHAESDENLWIQEGSGTMFVGDEAVAVTSGQWLHIPKGVKHRFESDGRAPLVALQMYVPSGPEQRFLKASTPQDNTPQDSTPQDNKP